MTQYYNTDTTSDREPILRDMREFINSGTEEVIVANVRDIQELNEFIINECGEGAQQEGLWLYSPRTRREALPWGIAAM